jgi:hypothetical protein
MGPGLRRDDMLRNLRRKDPPSVADSHASTSSSFRTARSADPESRRVEKDSGFALTRAPE